MRRGLFVLFLLAPLLAIPQARAQADVPVAVFEGRGWGHGVGLSQWGAEYAARNGATVNEILGTFYPGTQIGRATGQVRVSVYTSPNAVATLEFPDGGEIRSALSGEQAEGFPVRVAPGGRVRIGFDGSYRVVPIVSGQSSGTAVGYTNRAGGCIPLVDCPTTTTTTRPGDGGGSPCGLLGCSSTTTAPPRTTTPPATSPVTTSTTRPTTTTRPPPDRPGDGSAASGAPVWAVPDGGGATTALDRGRSYRGVVQATAGAGPLRLINQLDVETYLKGMGEVPGSWPVGAVAAQAIVARTYALRAMSFSGELCDYDLCQVYVGVGKENPTQNAAVDISRGQVLRYGDALASTVYSADAGGVSATTFEGFGTPDGVYPYLTTVRYETDNPLPYRTEVALSDIANRIAYPGTISAVAISDAGPSGRAIAVTLDGDAGPVTVDGRTFSSQLGLRSTLWDVTLSSSDAPPPPPPSGELVQALPEDTDAITEAATAGEDAALEAAGRTGDAGHLLVAVAATDFLAAGPAAAVLDDPAVALAVALLAVATAVAMAGWGFEPAGPGIPDHRRRPELPPLPSLPPLPPAVVSAPGRVRRLVAHRLTGHRRS